MPVEIFFSYAHEDERLMDHVRRQLVIFERQGKIVKWHDRKIPPGTEWEGQIDERLRSAHVILLFVSPHFIESRYCYDIEVMTALERHEQGDARVIPIILRPCAWEDAPFARLQALPKDGIPLTGWDDIDQAALETARGVMQAVEDLGDSEDAAGASGRGVERRSVEGDRIPRLMVKMTPAKVINMPKGYGRRLNAIRVKVVKDSAVSDGIGGFCYPAQFSGAPQAVQSFTGRMRATGELSSFGTDEEGGRAVVWFEYRGSVNPDEMKKVATAEGLEMVHCGVTLYGSPTG
jgi:hypothetical protein